MENFDAAGILRAVSSLGNFGQNIPDSIGMPTMGLAIPKENYAFLVNYADFLCLELERLDLSASLASANLVRRTLATVSPHPAPPGASGEFVIFAPLRVVEMKSVCRDLQTRLPDELKSRLIMALSTGKASYFSPSEPLFGVDVFNSFSSANDDISEAGACLALGRGTASVMHLMRACEVGLSALAKALGVGKQNDWGSYLREIEKALKVRAQTSGARSPDEQFYSEAATSFDYLKRAWRNPTMHVDRTYSSERAEEIFQAVKSFMRHLSSRLTE
jgi:hypothetical protein